MVPSSGSTSQRSPLPPSTAAPSSPTSPSSGRSARIMPAISASASRSASLTRSVRVLLAAIPVAGSPKRSASSAPARPGRPDGEGQEVLVRHGRSSSHDVAPPRPGSRPRGARAGPGGPAPGTRSRRPSGRAPARLAASPGWMVRSRSPLTTRTGRRTSAATGRRSTADAAASDAVSTRVGVARRRRRASRARAMSSGSAERRSGSATLPRSASSQSRSGPARRIPRSAAASGRPTTGTDTTSAMRRGSADLARDHRRGDQGHRLHRSAGGGEEQGGLGAHRVRRPARPGQVARPAGRSAAA